MSIDSADCPRAPDKETQPTEIRVCSVCGTKFCATGDSGFCPVCVLREAENSEPDATESGLESESEQVSTQSKSPAVVDRFENYELVKDQEGKPVELGRGAMGVTYRAFDVDLHCPVTLKVITEKYLDDESARLRFLREARAAASVRHPNVASVFHLGRSGDSYFYAMEFVEGETLEKLIKRMGRVEIKLALEIASQVAAGLAAVHKMDLVHRDIKPTNVMVSLEGTGEITAKIIDLGLAKALNESPSETRISTVGGFVGTPAFASPEHFAGIGVDIRSDLYSLGVTLWEMVTGHAVFRGSPAEVMYQHQHAPLPLEQLEDVSEPVVTLLEILLEKDPARRFQNPAELLKAIPRITNAIDAGHTITRQSLRETLPVSRAVTRRPQAILRPEKISVARLPITGSDLFGREEDISFLNDAWANQNVNIVTIVAWAGVGKSALVNHWLRRMARDNYRSAEIIFAWSFYRQGSSGDASSADEFLDSALTWFGDPDPRLGTPWEKGERLAKLVAQRRTLLVLDGLEPLQNPPGPQEGRVREASLQALLRELAAFNTGLCVITTRLPVADIADHERTSALRRDLEQLSSEAGAKLLRALGVQGHDEELRSASNEFGGHCLALTLLGSYLSEAYHGAIGYRKEVSNRLGRDVRQGVHARKVMASYQTWFGEGAELSVLRLLGFFDRPADERAVVALLKPPVIAGLTELLMDLNPVEWRALLARLRRARLLTEEDPLQPGQLDAHPLVREYFGEQLQRLRTEAWQEGNRRLYEHYIALALPLPDTFQAMEPLFLAVRCGCQAGLYRDALHEVYLPRVQRGNAAFAAKVLGARGALLSVLVHFFEDRRWGVPAQSGAEGQNLTAEDQLLILMEAGMCLTATRGMGASEARSCYERAEVLCHSLHRPMPLYSALMGQYLFSFFTDTLTATMQISQRINSLAQGQNNGALMISACGTLAGPLYFMGEFEAAYQRATRGVQLWYSGSIPSQLEETMPAVICQCFKALCEWHLGEIDASQTTMAEAISIAKELKDMYALVEALFFATMLDHFGLKAVEVERLASELVELSTRHQFALYAAGGKILRSWARSVSGRTAEGLAGIEGGIRDWRATEAILFMPYWLHIKGETLYLADRTAEALKAIKEAEALAERFEQRCWSADLHRLRGVFLAAIGADEAQIEASFCAAIETAKEQKSTSLAKRAEATYAEYRKQKANASAGRGLGLPLC
jgi:serine/threonine protein kinase